MTVQKLPLGDVCRIEMGQAPDGESYNDTGDGVPLIAGAGDFGDSSPEPKKFTTSAIKMSRIGDIILCIRATIGDRNWSDGEYCLGRGVAGLRADPRVLDQRYLWHWLDDAAPELRAKGRGATFLQVNKADIATMEVPLPSINEQRRIAAILDKADALRANHREVAAKFDRFLQSVFIEIFGDPSSNPKHWPKSVLGELASIQTGSTPPTSSPGFFEGPIPFVTPGDLGSLVRSSRRTLSMEGALKSRTAPAGSSLVCCIGATIGKMGLAMRECAFNQQINAVTWHDRVDSIYGYYLLYFLSAEIARRGSSTTLPIINKSDFEKIEVIVPPMGLQKAFSEIAISIQNQSEVVSLADAKCQELFRSIQNEFFAARDDCAR